VPTTETALLVPSTLAKGATGKDQSNTGNWIKPPPPATASTKSAAPAGGGAASSAGRIAKNLLTPKSMPSSGSSTSSGDDLSSLLDGIDVPLFKTTLKQVIQKQEPDALGLREINKFYNKL
jgi:hypothetical protein